MQLGPGVCLARVPECGRNFEYLSGEDPYLGNQLVQPVVTGIQSQVRHRSRGPKLRAGLNLTPLDFRGATAACVCVFV